jgi:ketosteroid isomerase-like protein
MNEAMGATDQVSAESLRALLAAFNQHDLDRIMEFFSEDATADVGKRRQ